MFLCLLYPCASRTGAQRNSLVKGEQKANEIAREVKRCSLNHLITIII
jgi:hypothetical protein